jgi:hypothetical protein
VPNTCTDLILGNVAFAWMRDRILKESVLITERLVFLLLIWDVSVSGHASQAYSNERRFSRGSLFHPVPHTK